MLVDLAGGDVVIAGQRQGEVPFVVSEIQVDFGACTKTQYEARDAAKQARVFWHGPDCSTKHSPCSAGAMRPASTDT